LNIIVFQYIVYISTYI